jgi:hypothetical protein
MAAPADFNQKDPEKKHVPVIDDVTVTYKVGSLSDVMKVMAEEANGLRAGGPHSWEFKMLGVELSAQPISSFAGERKTMSIHSHPLEPHLIDDPIAQFLMKEYGMSFEESSLVLSPSDVKHTLGTFAHGNIVAEKMGVPRFNTHEATAGTVLLDEDRKVILAGVLPVSRLSEEKLTQLQESATAAINEQHYKGRTSATLRKFYDIVVPYTIANDAQSDFLFGPGGITHLIGAKFSLGILDDGIAKILRAKGDLGGLPSLAFGKDDKETLFALMTASHATSSGSLVQDAMALPIGMIQPNQRVIEAVNENLLGGRGSIGRAEFENGLRRILNANSSVLQRVEIGGKVLRVLPSKFMLNDQNGNGIGIGTVGTIHSVHMAEHLIAYAMSRNTMTMKGVTE